MDAGRALITGATGMIGAALTQRLLEDGWAVHVLTRAGSSRERLTPYLGRISVDVIAWDEPEALTRAVAAANPTVVFHLAGPPFNPPTLPLSIFVDAAVNSTVALLKALDDAANPARIVFAGSAAVYGEPAHAPETQPLAPTTWLGAAKAMASVLLATAGRKTGRGVVELRLYTPYGPSERLDRLIPSVIAAAAAGRPIPLSAGEQERDFVYIDDVIDAFLAAACFADAMPATFNIGSGVGTSVRALVTTLLTELGAAELARFGAVPTRPDEIMRMAADISAAVHRLGWTPRTSLDDGLRSTIAAYALTSKP